MWKLLIHGGNYTGKAGDLILPNAPPPIEIEAGRLGEVEPEKVIECCR
jgi:hypothetical protein